jgi:hypothetical protein
MSAAAEEGWRVAGPQPIGTFVKADVTDQLVQLSVQLAAELWMTRRRLAAIEAQLVTAGLITSPDQLAPGAEPEDRTGRDEFIQRLFSAFLT